MDLRYIIYYIIWLHLRSYYMVAFYFAISLDWMSDRAAVWHHLWDPSLIECINVAFSVVKGHRSHSMCHILFQCCRPVDVYLYVAEMTPLSLSLIWRIALLQFGLRQ